MTSFVALNVEVESESEDDIDDSKEIQIEEALKLYQNALKLHSQGPNYFAEAEAAYKELFSSEIFLWDESLSEARRLEQYDDDFDRLEDEVYESQTLLLVSPTLGLDGSPSSLPQILYLAYKNHGLFLLDGLRHDILRLEADILSTNESSHSDAASGTVSSSLALFVEALDRDDTDLELWRLVSKLGGVVGSPRIARFCLETVLDNDDGDFGASTEPSGLEEGFAEEQIKPLLEALDDQLSRSQLSHLYGKPRDIITAFKQQLDPCPYLPTPAPSPRGDDTKIVAEPQVIDVPSRSWSSCGKAILLRLDQEVRGIVESSPGASYCLAIPPPRPLLAHVPDPLTLTNGDHPAISDQAPPINTESSLEEAPKSASTEEGPPVNRMLPESAQASPTEVAPTSFEELPSTSVNASVGPDGYRPKLVETEEIATQLEQSESHPDVAFSTSLPTRKRSHETAELPESHDAGRTKSKRIKARGSLDHSLLKDSSTAEEWARWFEQQLQIYHDADDAAFGAVSKVITQLGLEEPLPLQVLRDIVSRSATMENVSDHNFESQVAYDLKSSLNGWNLIKSKAFLNGHDPQDPAGGIGGNRSPEFAAFLESSSQFTPNPSQLEQLSDDYGLEDLERHIVEPTWISLSQVAFQWLDQLLGLPIAHASHEAQTLYESHLWPDSLKESVVQMLVYQDHTVCAEINRLIEDTNQKAQIELHILSPVHPSDESLSLKRKIDHAKSKCIHLAQTVFELHLDVYGLITKTSSKVDGATRTLQRERLCRWFTIASRLISQWSWLDYKDKQWSKALDYLRIRFLWASVVYKSLLNPTCRDDIILCYRDLVRVLEYFFNEANPPTSQSIQLPNNAIMPEISVSVAEKEISRLTMMDFFMEVFNYDNVDPFNVIESLEPLLEYSIDYSTLHKTSDPKVMDETSTISSLPQHRAFESSNDLKANSQMLEALHFLGHGNIALHLLLWQKLRDAYRAIACPPQVLACDLRMMTLIVDHLSSHSNSEKPVEHRRDSLLRWLHRLDDHISRVLTAALSGRNPFEFVDGDQIRMALLSVTKMQKLLHVFSLWEDTIRVGRTPPPVQRTQSAVNGLAKSTDKFRDMIVKTWVLQYTLLREIMTQYPALFTSQEQQLAEHLQKAHQSLGLRCYCSLANKMFLKLMKVELESFKLTGDWDSSICQLMFDLYGVKISLSVMEMQDHGCLTENLDKSTALEIMDLVMTQVNRISVKELMKSDLKFTVDKMQQVIKIPLIAKSPSRTFNFRLVNQYLKAPLNPYDLFRSLKGIGGLCDSPVSDDGSDVAGRGWYYLLGNMAFAKFRSLKRSSVQSTDDLSVARTFFRHDLEFSTNRWETWYRLGQVFDTTLEEDITWTAEKLDHQIEHIADLQRKVIHCYSMALAIATQSAEGSFEDASTIADLCADFGIRIYASTREPFSMRAFGVEGHKRHFNSRAGGMYQSAPFRGMQMYPAWKLASILLRRATMQKPQNWITAYNLGKVLWKMHSCADEVQGSAKRIGFQPVIDALVRAIEACPDKKDNRHPDKDPILEPHYKLLSVVHKLVKSTRISSEEGCHILKATPYSCKASNFNLQEDGNWNGYVWQILKALRAADKANWHHRMVARAAHILYDDDPSDPRSALGAKHEMNQQIFTKTMALQVWKPDNERPGRHFVYTNRYVRFFTRLLYQLNDKGSMETLTRRVRKKISDYVDHNGVWEEACRAYLKLLHHQPDCPIMEGYAEHIFQGMNPEIFQAHSARLETHIHAEPNAPPLVNILREAIELKKLNGTLLKPPTIFDDLIRDAYAHLFDSMVAGLVAADAVEERRIRMSVDNMLTNEVPAVVDTPPPRDGGEEAPKKSGARYITPKEIVRKGEAIATRPAPTVPAKVLKPLAPAPAGEEAAKSLDNPTRLAVVMNADNINDAASSAPGSVHDSADDESELTEVDEDVAERGSRPIKKEVPVRKPLFPGLIGTTAENPQEIDGDTNDEQTVEVDDDGDEQVNDEVLPHGPAKESRVHEGSW